MRSRGLLILSLVVLGLGVFIWFVERDLPTTEEREAREGMLIDQELEAIDSVTLTYQGREIVLERESMEAADEEGAVPPVAMSSRDWWLAQPLQAKAESTAVESFVSQILDLESRREIAEGAPEGYDLDLPELRIVLGTEEGDRRLDIGVELPGSSKRMVRLDGGPGVFVVEIPFFDKGTQDTIDWRDRQLFPATQDTIHRMKIRGPHGEVVLTRRGDRFWLESPWSDVGAKEEIDVLIGTLSAFEVTNFLDAETADLEALGLQPALGEVDVFIEGREEPLRVAWGLPASEPVSPPSGLAGGPASEAVAGTFFARFGSDLVETNAAPLDAAFQRPPSDWRSRAWMSLRTYSVERVEVSRGDERSTLVRDAAGWQRDESEIPGPPVERLLAELAGVRAVSIVDSETDYSGRPSMTINLIARDGTMETLSLFPEGANGFSATVSGRQAMLQLSSETVEAIESRLLDIREAEAIVQEPEAGISDNELSVEGGPA